MDKKVKENQGKIMTFREKIDTIVRINKLGIDSPSALEAHIGVGMGSITKYYRKDEEPGIGTIKKILELPGLNPVWWETGIGPVFSESDEFLRESTPLRGHEVEFIYKQLYDKLLGENSDYIVINKELLKTHRLVSVEQLEEDRANLERRAFEMKFLLETIREFHTRPINVHLPDVQKTKE